jgi:hypothetical protein
MKAIPLMAATLLMAALLPAAQAKEAAGIGDCVTLSSSHAGTRAAGNTQLLLKDGDAHYRVRFAGSCEALYRSSVVHLEAEGQANRLCPAGTSVRAGNARCAVRSVEALTAAEYNQQARRNRR